MLRRITQLAAILLVALASLTPLLELFDHWDGTHTIPANDTEMRVTFAAALGGLLFATARLIRTLRRRGASRPRQPHRASASITFLTPASQLPAPTTSPPLIALRI